MTYLNLFLGFLKVGCFSFGGAYMAIPLIRDVVLSYGWMDEEMLAYMIAVSESTPGPIMINLATYVGTVRAGLPGAVLATFAVALPAFLIILLVTAMMSKVLARPGVQAFVKGMKPAVAGIILATGMWMILKNLFEDGFASPDIRAVAITGLLAAVYFGVNSRAKERAVKSKLFGARRMLHANANKAPKGMSPIALIVCAAVLGVIVYGV